MLSSSLEVSRPSIFFFTGTIKISWTFSHFILVKWRVRYCWKIKCARVLIAHQISSTKGVLTKFPLEAIVFFPDMNFFATWKTNETKFVMQNSNPNDKSLMGKTKHDESLKYTTISKRYTITEHVGHTHLFIITIFQNKCLSLLIFLTTVSYIDNISRRHSINFLGHSLRGMVGTLCQRLWSNSFH